MKLITNKQQHEIAVKLLRIIDISHQMCNTDPGDYTTIEALMSEHGTVMADIVYDICGQHGMVFVINELDSRTKSTILKMEGMLNDINNDTEF